MQLFGAMVQVTQPTTIPLSFEAQDAFRHGALEERAMYNVGAFARKKKQEHAR
jgi:hypothetical protein